MIKRIKLILIVRLLPCLHAFAGPEWQVYFSPTGGCTAAITNELGKATNEVLVQAYSFTSEPIANALMAAHDRGVKVTVILDKGQKSVKNSEAGSVSQDGITTLINRMSLIRNGLKLIKQKTLSV